MTRRTRQRGVTLVELLVALGIFSLFSLASFNVLTLAQRGSAQLAAATDEARAIERARSLMRADLSQIVARPVRDADGRAMPALAGGEGLADPRGGLAGAASGETVLLTLTRSGWDDPGNLHPRSELQRVAYLVRDGDLIRRVRPYLDAAPNTPVQDQTLLSNVTQAAVAFHDGREWRAGFTGEVGAEAALPTAVRFTFDHPALGLADHDFLAGPQ